ncbi:hypothetical protein GOODEAATRI_022385 [Goodea atripinnis]|uniref:Uncharacterized protein n=1 Tax=Goodea atripinnis TaxID=208336 RepID=A0ABV0PG23_9TELE
MYENEDSGEIAEDDLAVILEIMLGVKEVELSPLFLQLQASDMRKITYANHSVRLPAVFFHLSALVLTVQMVALNSCATCRGEEEALWRTYNLHIEQHLSAVILRFSCFKKVGPDHYEKDWNLVTVFREPSPLVILSKKNLAPHGSV